MTRTTRWNQEEEAKARAIVVSSAERFLSGELRLAEASLLLVSVRASVTDDDFDPDFRIFVVVESDSDHLPVGPSRDLWAESVLPRKLAELSEIEDFYHEEATESCRRLIERFGKAT